MQIVEIEQGTDEWFALRLGKMTASHAQAIAAKGKGLVTYIMEMLQEKYSNAEKEIFKGKDIERGNTLEDSAAYLYSRKSKLPTYKVGFVIMDEYIGCSPDLLLGDEGLAEIKCPADKGYFKLLIDGEIETKYIWQMQMQMLVTGRKWCDFVAYNPNYDKELKIIRVEADEKAFAKLMLGFEEGKKLIEEIESKYQAIIIQDKI